MCVIVGVVGRRMTCLKHAYLLTPRTYKYVILHFKRNWGLQMELRMLMN
jgi:monoamine oxidase